MQTLDRIQEDVAKMRLLEAQGRLVNADPVEVDFECPVCGQEQASAVVSLGERVAVTPLGEDHKCFEPLWCDIEELFTSGNPIARAAVRAIEVYYSEREDEDTL